MTQYNDFRSFLEFIERRGLLKRVTKEVSTRFEIAAGIRKVSDTNGPVLLYENVKDHPGWRVAAGVFATRKMLAEVLEVPIDKMLDRYEQVENKFIPPREVSSGPVQEIVLTGNDIDLRSLPVVVHSEHDVGPYITGGVQYAEDPETGIGNLGMHRMLVLDKDRLTLWAPPDHHIGRMIVKAEDHGKGVPVAVMLGADPRITMASQVKAAYGVNEMEMAGGIKGSPMELVRCKTIPIYTEANAEICIEGVTVPGERTTDGPFAEYTGCYSGSKDAPVFKVSAITMRKNAIYQACLTGMPVTENHVLVDLPYTTRLRQDLRRVAPEAVAINVTPGGTMRHHVIVAIRKRHQEEARNVILALLGAGIGLKQVTVVDDDIDVNNPMDVEWALATRMQPDQDMIVVPRLTCSTLDPSVPSPRTTSGLGIDATKPVKESWKFAKVVVPGVEKVDYV